MFIYAIRTSEQITRKKERKKEKEEKKPRIPTFCASFRANSLSNKSLALMSALLRAGSSSLEATEPMKVCNFLGSRYLSLK